MIQFRSGLLILLFLRLGLCAGQAQIDPVKRSLFQLGYNVALQGHSPLAIYAFYYRNQPNFLDETNLTLRLALAPVYIDSELGISQALGPNTDLGIGLAGGGFADSYSEVRRGSLIPSESFTGHDGELSVSVYHLFNPGSQIPLYGVVRGIAHYSTYVKDDQTASDFHLPNDHTTFAWRTGLRWGGREPMLFPDLAMAISVWYEGEFRTDAGEYGFDDRKLEAHSHLFWGEALLDYTLPKCKHSFYLSVAAGTSVEADRLSAYRLGGLLPLISEFPLSLPGYYYQELTAKSFVLLGGNYILPLDHEHHWNLAFSGSTAAVDYLAGLDQPGHWNSGLGGGLLYKSPSWKIMAGYSHGIDAIRSHGRGSDSIGLLLQFDLERANFFHPTEPGLWRGMQEFFNIF